MYILRLFFGKGFYELVLGFLWSVPEAGTLWPVFKIRPGSQTETNGVLKQRQMGFTLSFHCAVSFGESSTGCGEGGVFICVL